MNGNLDNPINKMPESPERKERGRFELKPAAWLVIAFSLGLTLWFGFLNSSDKTPDEVIDEDKVVIEPIKTKEDLVNLRRRSTTEEFLRISGENYPIDENSNISYISHEVSSNEEIIITGFGYYTSGKAEDIKAKWLSFAEEASWVREEEEGERRLKFTETSGVPVFISIEQDSDSQTLQYVVVEIGESYLF